MLFPRPWTIHSSHIDFGQLGRTHPRSPEIRRPQTPAAPFAEENSSKKNARSSAAARYASTGSSSTARSFSQKLRALIAGTARAPTQDPGRESFGLRWCPGRAGQEIQVENSGAHSIWRPTLWDGISGGLRARRLSLGALLRRGYRTRPPKKKPGRINWEGVRPGFNGRPALRGRPSWGGDLSIVYKSVIPFQNRLFQHQSKSLRNRASSCKVFSRRRSLFTSTISCHLFWKSQDPPKRCRRALSSSAMALGRRSPNFA